MRDVSTFRLYALRFGYLLIGAGLALTIWPLLADPPADLEHMRGVVWALLGALGLLSLVGLRYPLRMLPLLLFELTWKVVWVLALWLPRWSAGTLNDPMRTTFVECLVGIVLCLLVIPWGYVVRNYVRAPGDRWRGPARPGRDAAVEHG